MAASGEHDARNKLPQPGPALHAAMFRDRTLQDITRARDALRILAVTSAAARNGTDRGGNGCSSTPASVATSAGGDEGGVLDTHVEALVAILERLEDYVVDTEVLLKTEIGKTVKKLQLHVVPQVAERARALVDLWKRDRAIREQVVDGFEKKGGLSKRAARELERGLFATATPLGILEGQAYASYQKHYKRLCTHLRNRDEGSLVKKIETGAVALSKVASMPDSELLSSSQRQQRLEAEKEGLKAALGGTTETDGIITQDYRCPKCAGSRTAYKEVQTGWHNDQQDMTIMVLCLECDHRWKEGDDHGLGGS